MDDHEPAEEFVSLLVSKPSRNGSLGGGELLPETVYPLRDGRLVSQSPAARAGRGLAERLQSPLDRVERSLDTRLRALLRCRMRRARVVACISPKGGTGKTSLALLVAMRLRWPALVIDADLTGGTARSHIPTDGRSDATWLDALAAIRAGTVRGPMDLAPYLCTIPGNAFLLAAPQDPAVLDAITVEDVRKLIDAVRLPYPVSIVDCAPGVGARDEAQRFIHGAASDLLAVLLPRRVDTDQAKTMLGYLRALPGRAVDGRLNALPRRPDEGARYALEVRVVEGAAGHVELPSDDALRRRLDAAVLGVDGLHQRTRIAIKQLVVSLVEAWV